MKLDKKIEGMKNKIFRIISQEDISRTEKTEKVIEQLSQLLQESGEVEYERGVAHGKLQEALLQEEPIPETYISDTTEYPTNKEAKE